MAGGKDHLTVFNADPALMKWYHMNKNRYKYFKWTPRTAKISFIYVIAIPGALLYLANKTEGKYEFKNKRRGDIISEW